MELSFPTDTIFWTIVSAVIALGGVLSVAVLTIMQRMAEKTEATATFYLQVTDRYNTPQMHESLYLLMDFHFKNTLGFAVEFAEQFERRTEQGVRLDKARREVNRYFVNIGEMYGQGLIGRKLAASLCNFQGLNIFYQVVVPMNIAKYGEQKDGDRIYRKLKRLRAQYGDGSFGLRSAYVDATSRK